MIEQRRTGKTDTWTAIYRAGWLILGVIFVLVVVAAFVPKARRLNALRRRLADLQEQCRRGEAQKQELRMKQDRFSRDPAYVERIAKEANMIRPDEIVFRVTNTAPSPNREPAAPYSGRGPP